MKNVGLCQNKFMVSEEFSNWENSVSLESDIPWLYNRHFMELHRMFGGEFLSIVQYTFGQTKILRYRSEQASGPRKCV